jgi:hypothetical protein
MGEIWVHPGNWGGQPDILKRFDKVSMKHRENSVRAQGGPRCWLHSSERQSWKKLPRRQCGAGCGTLGCQPGTWGQPRCPAGQRANRNLDLDSRLTSYWLGKICAFSGASVSPSVKWDWQVWCEG